MRPSANLSPFWDNDDTVFGGFETIGVFFGGVSDDGSRLNHHMFVDDHPMKLASSTNDHIVHHHRFIDKGKTVNTGVVTHD